MLRQLSRASLIGAIALVAACSTPLNPRPCATPSANPLPLRDAAKTCGLLIGAAVDAQVLRTDSQYGKMLSRDFSIVTPENAMKFDAIHPARDIYDFKDADTIVNFAASNGMLVRGHTLVFYQGLPTWLTAGDFTSDELKTILRDHISTVMGRYRGRVYAWDVVNEALNDDGSPRETLWSQGIGQNYIDLAFQWAHQADPQAKLFYNDDKGEAGGAKADAIYNLVKGLKDRGVPIDGVGFQSHLTLDSPPKAESVAATMKRFADLGLEIHVTELDVQVKMPALPQQLDAEARVYRDMLAACLSVPNCRSFGMWGVTDKYSWIPKNIPGAGAGLLLNESYQPKPAYQALSDFLNGRR